MRILTCLHNLLYIAARKCAEQFLASYDTGSRQKREIESFAHTLTYTLQACFNNIKGSKSRKEKICEQFYHTRCSNTVLLGLELLTVVN